MRTFRTVALGATLLALLVGACSSGGQPITVGGQRAAETSAPSEPAAESHPLRPVPRSRRH